MQLGSKVLAVRRISSPGFRSLNGPSRDTRGQEEDAKETMGNKRSTDDLPCIMTAAFHPTWRPPLVRRNGEIQPVKGCSGRALLIPHSSPSEARFPSTRPDSQTPAQGGGVVKSFGRAEAAVAAAVEDTARGDTRGICSKSGDGEGASSLSAR
ncbi:hypothetical protein KUCAC02_018554 [Chaenocephalus aceratus]|uniref:Uncharacterized protein n=1 Tax=Chaenocephalus aceratus TaxID=36190 RepID=A0ACB9W9R9_CHAAC|nr:hypothetical protein KUCAC02_018554 [Chaenocephalus aceratus]